MALTGLLLGLSTFVHADAGDKPLSIMFTSGWDSAAKKIVEENVGVEDYVGLSMQKRMKDKKPPGGVPLGFTLPPSLARVEEQAAQSCPTGGNGELIVYDPEKWEQTPPQELDNLAGSIARAATLVHKKGCFKFGLAPVGAMVGRKGCKASPNHMATEIDWKKVDVFIIQAQSMLSERCGGIKNVPEYAKFLTEWTRIIKPLNPNIKIMGHFSFRHSPPETMRAAIRETRTSVDGYYLAYPKESKGEECAYCSPENLEEVIHTIKAKSNPQQAGRKNQP